MEQQNFTVTLSLTAEQISDVLCSALEGGSNYWCSLVRGVKPTAWVFDSEPKRENGRHWVHDYPLNPGGVIIFTDAEEGDEKELRLDAQALHKGLAVLAEKHPQHITDMLTENADADTGDALLQCCLFGEIVYS